MPKYLITKCLQWNELSQEQRAKVIDKNRDIRLDWLSNEDIIWEFSEAGNKIAEAGFLNPDVYYVYNHCQGQGACFECSEFNWELLLEDLNIPHKKFFISLLKDSQDVLYGIRKPYASYAHHYLHERCRVFYIQVNSYRDCLRLQNSFATIAHHIEQKRLDLSQEAFSEICKAIDWLQSDACITEELECRDWYYNEETFWVMKITVIDRDADIRYENGNDELILEKHINYTAMPEGEYELWGANHPGNRVILMNTEY